MKKGALHLLGRKNRSLFDTNVKMTDMGEQDLLGPLGFHFRICLLLLRLTQTVLVSVTCGEKSLCCHTRENETVLSRYQSVLLDSFWPQCETLTLCQHY